MSAGDALIDGIAAAVAKVIEPVVEKAVQRAVDAVHTEHAGPKLLNLEEVSERLGCGIRTTHKHVAQGRLRVVRPSGKGGRPMVRIDELERFLEAAEE